MPCSQIGPTKNGCFLHSQADTKFRWYLGMADAQDADRAMFRHLTAARGCQLWYGELVEGYLARMVMATINRTEENIKAEVIPLEAA